MHSRQAFYSLTTPPTQHYFVVTVSFSKFILKHFVSFIQCLLLLPRLASLQLPRLTEVPVSITKWEFPVPDYLETVSQRVTESWGLSQGGGLRCPYKGTRKGVFSLSTSSVVWDSTCLSRRQHLVGGDLALRRHRTCWHVCPGHHILQTSFCLYEFLSFR